MPFRVASKIIKFLGINVTKEVKCLYQKKKKKLMKKMEEDTNKWKYIPCSWIRRLYIVKISILPEAIYSFNTILIKIFSQKWKNQCRNL